MSSPHRPLQVDQLDGSRFAGFNCGCAVTAMAVDRATLGQTRVSSAYVRTLTGDTSGGTNLSQQAVAAAKLGVKLELSIGGPIGEMWDALSRGCGVSLSGSSSATRGTRWQASETFSGNHQWFLNEGRSWTDGRPAEVLVYDPLGDARRSTIVQSPFWIPRLYVERFAAGLVLSPSSGQKLGPGRVYAGTTRDTEPHVHLKYVSSKPTVPFPRVLTVKAPTRNVRAGAGTNFRVLRTLPAGATFTAYQVTDLGLSLNGSRRWWGSHQGDEWFHDSGVAS